MASSVLLLCSRCIRWFPVLFVAAVLAWSYYAYVVRLCLVLSPGPSLSEKVVYIIIYHILLVFFIWSYGMAIFTKPAAVPDAFYLSDEKVRELQEAATDGERLLVLKKFSESLPLVCRGIGNEVRYCNKCLCFKPDRAHHCSTCNKCILKMDHHCPWVNNCVGFSTYKYFLLFLFYTHLYCLYIIATDLQYFVQFWTGLGALNGSPPTDFHVMFLFIVAAMFGFAVLGLFGYHIHLSCKNSSTLESMHAPIFNHGVSDKNGFNMGAKHNLREVFGDKSILWCLPIWSTKGDGINYMTQTPAPLPSFSNHAPVSNQYDQPGSQPLSAEQERAIYAIA